MIGWDCNRKKEQAMERNRKIAISAGVATTLAAGAIAFLAWRKGRDVMGRFKTWKKNKIQDAYFDSLTEKDVAWG